MGECYHAQGERFLLGRKATKRKCNSLIFNSKKSQRLYVGHFWLSEGGRAWRNVILEFKGKKNVWGAEALYVPIQVFDKKEKVRKRERESSVFNFT